MSDDFQQAYWAKLRSAWSDTFVNDVIRKFDDPAYVQQVGDTLGYSKDAILGRLEAIDRNGSEPLGWRIYDAIWKETFERVVSTGTDLGFDVPEIPLIGTLPTGRVNALAIRVPGSDRHILAFEVGLLLLVVKISDYAAAHLHPVAGGNSFEFQPETNPAYTEALVKMMLDYYSNGMPGTSHADPAPPAVQRTLSQGFRDIIKLFVAGHEYGHIRLGHLTSGGKQFFQLAGGIICDTTVGEDAAREFEADQAGLLIAAACYARKGLPYWFSGPVILYFLKFADHIYSGLSFLLDKPVADKSHPPVSDRIRHLEGVLMQLIPEKEQGHFFAVRGIYDKLLQDFESAFYAVVAQKKAEGGMSYAPMWSKLTG
jgi:hypothetical protein